MNGSCGELYGVLNTTIEAVLYGLVNIVLIIVASLLNISILFLIKTRSILHQPSFTLLAALACADLATVCICGTLYLAIALRGVSEDGTIEMVNCVITSSATINNLLLLCCITHDRYLCIKHSISSRPYTTQRRIAVKIALCILVSCTFSSTFYIEAVYSLPFRTVELLFCIVSGCFLYITLYYRKLSCVVKRHQMSSLPLGPENSNSGLVRRAPSRQSNLNRSIFLLVAAYVFAFIPTSITAIIRNILYRLSMPQSHGLKIAIMWCTTFSFSNALMDPLIYACRSDAIGRELRKVCSTFFFHMLLFLANHRVATTPGNSWKLLECNLTPGKCRKSWKTPGKPLEINFWKAVNMWYLDNQSVWSRIFELLCKVALFSILESKLLKKFRRASLQPSVSFLVLAQTWILNK